MSSHRMLQAIFLTRSYVARDQRKTWIHRCVIWVREKTDTTFLKTFAALHLKTNVSNVGFEIVTALQRFFETWKSQSQLLRHCLLFNTSSLTSWNYSTLAVRHCGEHIFEKFHNFVHLYRWKFHLWSEKGKMFLYQRIFKLLLSPGTDRRSVIIVYLNIILRACISAIKCVSFQLV